MIGFASPELLALAPLAPLVAWRAVRRRRPALRFPDLGGFDGLPRGRAARAVWGGATLRGLALLLLAVAAAGPRTPDERTRLPAVALALDVSGSMGEPDYPAGPGAPPTTRLAAAKRVFRLFVEGGDAGDGVPFPGRPADQLGLVTFAAVPRTACPLTLDHAALLAILDRQDPRDGVDAGTNVGDGIAEALLRLDAAGPRAKVLVLLSDGEHNAGSGGALTPRQAAQLAANLGVPVYAVDCGGDPDPGHSEQRDAGRAVLQSVAKLTNGRYLPAADAPGLRAAVREIDALTRTPAETFRYRRYHDHGRGFALAGIGLLALVQTLERTRWRRAP
jgi:Ca-activated chloride channel family protein